MGSYQLLAQKITEEREIKKEEGGENIGLPSLMGSYRLLAHKAIVTEEVDGRGWFHMDMTAAHNVEEANNDEEANSTAWHRLGTKSSDDDKMKKINLKMKMTRWKWRRTPPPMVAHTHTPIILYFLLLNRNKYKLRQLENL